MKDFTQGPIFGPMVKFAIPIVVATFLQQLYNTADKIVVGQFSSESNALGAIGCTASLYTLLVALCGGLSMGSGVTVAHRFGERDERALSRAVHTAFLVGAAIGVFIGLVGFIFSRPLLVLIGTKPEFLELSVLYLRIICLGTPLSILYSFGASVLRSLGNAKAPLWILGISGLLNVGFNLLFVLAFDMSVEGVAYGTIIAQLTSAIAVWWMIAFKTDCVRFRFRDLCIDKRAVSDIVRVGIPSGVQASLFAVSNVLLQSGINSFDSATVTGDAICKSIGSYTAATATGVYQAVLTFTGQNAGAKKRDRVRRVLWCGMLIAFMACALVGWGSTLLANPLISLFVDKSTPDLPVIYAAAKERMYAVLVPYVLCGVMDALTGHLRGRKCSLIPMFSSLFCTCVFRVFWIVFLFPHLPHTLTYLYLCYGISWTMNIVCHLVTVLWLNRRERKKEALAQ